MLSSRNTYTNLLIILLGISLVASEHVGKGEGEYFQNFLDDSAAKAGINACHADDSLMDSVDTLIYKLVEASKGPDGERLIEGALQAMRLKEVLAANSSKDRAPASAPTVKPKFNFQPRTSTLSLLDALQEPVKEPNQNIVLARRRVDFDKTIQELKKHGDIKRLPKHQEQVMFDVASEILEHDDLIDSAKNDLIVPTRGSELSVGPANAVVRTAVNMVKKLSQMFFFGIKLAELFFESPEFLTNIPILGEKVKEFKEMGEPFYRIISLVRSASYLYKLKAVTDDDKKLDLTKEPMAKRIVSQAGGRALKSFAHAALKKIGHKKISEENAEKFVSNTFYAVLSSVMSAGGSCTMPKK